MGQSSFRNYLNIIVLVAKWFLAAVSTATWFTATFMADSNPHIQVVWRISATTALFAFIAETYIASRERREAEAAQASLENHIAELNGKLSVLSPRRLTTEQKAQIVDAMKQYQPTPMLVRHYLNSSDAADFARDFVITFQKAGLTCSAVTGDSDFGDFENVAVCLGPEDAIPGHYPLPVLDLMCVLANLGLTIEPSHMIVNDLKKGEFRLWVGANPNRLPIPRKYRFSAAKMSSTTSGEETTLFVQATGQPDEFRLGDFSSD